MRRVPLGLILLAPLLGAGKCIPYDESLAREGDPAGGGGGQGSGAACADPNEAHLIVRDYEFAIACGCKETPWEHGGDSRTCTIDAGQTVVWSFQGSEIHNLTSLRNTFGSSSDRSSGNFAHTFESPGSFGYECSIHPGPMSGYGVDVVEVVEE